MGPRWAAAAVLGIGMLALGVPAAHAEDPVDLRGAYVLDTVGAIAGDEAQVQDAIDTLWERARIQLFVVYVDTFTSPSDPVAWADETAIRNGMVGADDVLLAIAIDDRQYGLSVDPDFTLTDAQLDEVEAAIQDQLRDNRWADAAIDGALAMQAAATGVVGPGPTTPDEPQPAPASGGVSPVVPIIGGVAVVGVGVFIYSRVRKRKDPAAPTGRLSQAELDRRAGTLLVRLDDAIKTSEQELGFAIAQFGEHATGDFRAALAGAKQKVAEAFTLRQQLDDAQPDTPEQQREWTTRIIQLCEEADAQLDAQADAFDELRELEKTAPQALAAVREAAGAARERADGAEAALVALASRYSAAAISGVADNATQARQLLHLADEAMADAGAALQAGNPAEAALEVRTAQQSLGQVEQLAGAIDALAADLGEASAKLEALAADTRNDVQAARAMPQDDAATALLPAIAAAEAALEGASASDPVAAIERVEAAHAELEKLYVGARAQQERLAHAKAQLDGTLTSARAQLTSAMEYISTRRGGIGEVPRTRVHEAQRLLDQATALAATDPVAALGRAQQARRLASAALSLARSEVQSYQSRYDQGSGVDGGILGGLLGGLLGDSGYGSGYRSGSSWRSGSSSRSSWGSSRSSRPSRTSRSGSFGGSSRSSRRSSGGRRSRGGRF